jgi:hypothetical protein
MAKPLLDEALWAVLELLLPPDPYAAPQNSDRSLR